MIFNDTVLIYHILSHGLEAGGDLGRAHLRGDLCSGFPFISCTSLIEELGRESYICPTIQNDWECSRKQLAQAQDYNSEDMINTGLGVPIKN